MHTCRWVAKGRHCFEGNSFCILLAWIAIRRFWDRARKWEILKVVRIRNFEKGALKMGYLHQIVRNGLSNLRQKCDNIPHPLCDARNRTSNFVQIWPAICYKFAQHLPRERPLLRILIGEGAKSLLGPGSQNRFRWCQKTLAKLLLPRPQKTFCTLS